MVESGAALRSGGSASGIHALSVGGNWTNNGTVTLNTNANTGVAFIGSNQQVIGGSSVTEFRNLTVNSGATVVLPTTATVAGTLINNGTIQQTQNVTGPDNFAFLGLGSYGSVILNNADGSDLGQTTVTIRGNQVCNVGDELVNRCLDILPANTSGLDATATFFWHESELNSNVCANMNAYRWNGASWDAALTLDGGYGNGGRDCSASLQSLRVTGVAAFSPFGLSSEAPTAVTLHSLTATAATPLWVVLLITVTALAAAATLIRRRRLA